MAENLTKASSPRPASRLSFFYATPDVSVRPEIQALRALAVLAVLIFHAFPARLTGGYIGVDVFFAISGYLITGHLARSIAAGQASVIRKFYVRRVRRLVPASLLVLLFVTVTTFFFCPPTLWLDFSQQIIGSTFLAENWVLAANSVDYLAISKDVSPVENFWSLSVEEQFYLMWPALLLVANLVAIRFSASRIRSLLWVVFSVTLVSFAFSVMATALVPNWAYFATPTRAWEFGLGGVLALVTSTSVSMKKLSPRCAAVLSWAGVLIITVPMVVFTSETQLPGYLALLPVLGTMVVILAGPQQGRFSPAFLMNLKVVQKIGDASYSIYLWHWPLLILVPIVIGGYGSDLNRWGLLAVLAAAIIVGLVSKKYVEDPFRSASTSRSSEISALSGSRSKVVSVIAATTVVVVIVALAGTLLGRSNQMLAQARDAEASFSVAEDPCFGAASMAGKSAACAASTTSVDPSLMVPSPLLARYQRTHAECLQLETHAEVIVCHLGVSAGVHKRIAVAGDSHAKQWLPALEVLAVQNGWAIDTYLKAGCAFSHAVSKKGDCNDWNASVASRLQQESYDELIVSALSTILPNSAPDQTPIETAVAGYRSAWMPFIQKGTGIVALADTPKAMNAGMSDPPSCLSVHPASDCVFTRALGLSADPIAKAATSTPGVHLVDLSNYFCTDTECPTVIGNAVVYSDNNHVTQTYSQSMAPYLGAALVALGL